MTSKFRPEPRGSGAPLWRADRGAVSRLRCLMLVALSTVLAPGGCPGTDSPLPPALEPAPSSASGSPSNAQPSNAPLPDDEPPLNPPGDGPVDPRPDGDPAPSDAPADNSGGQESLAPSAADVRAALFDGTTAAITLEGRSHSGLPLTFSIEAPPATGTLGAVTQISSTRAQVLYTAPASSLGEAQFSFSATDGLLESNIATAILTLHPRVHFTITRADARRGEPIQLQAHASAGRTLPAGIYAWTLDEHVESGPATTHAAHTATFATGGAHTVRLSLTPAGAVEPFECISGTSGTQTTGIVTIWPRITGRIRDAGNAPIAGVRVDAVGQAFTATTDAAGLFMLDVPVLWSGALRPTKSGYSFAPLERSYVSLFADIDGADFVGTLNPVNQPPAANPQSVTTPEATTHSIILAGSDPNGDPLTYIVAALPAHATLRDAATNALISAGQLPYTLATAGRTVAYTPTAGYSGGDAFTFRVSDGQFNSAPATVSITITAVIGAIVYVDGQLSGSSCTTYNVATRTCSGGAATAYRTFAGAAAAAQPGHTVLIRSGTYIEQLRPARSGTSAQPITFRAYGTDTPTISGSSLSPAIDISDRSWIVVEGLRISTVRRWLLAVNAHHNVIRNNIFEHASDSGGSARTGVFFEASTYNQVLDNILDDSSQDNLALVQSDRNLVAGNTITNASHALFTIKCGNYNVLRGNYFYNPHQKIGEAYDCDGVGVDHDIYATNATRYNVIEENVFNFTPSSGNASPFAGIQYAAQYGIIRRNVFFDTTGPALDMTLYGGEAEFNSHNRAYHNVFHGTDFAGIAIPGSGYNFTGNLFKNNVLYRSTFVRNDTRWDWYIELNGKPVQVLISRLDGFVFDRNCIFHTTAGQTYTITHGSRFNTNNGTQHNVAWWHTNHPTLFTNNVELDPRFVDPAARDYHLLSNSPMIDAAASLTRTVTSGSGTSLRVEDSGYFSDGFGIAGELGDEIQLAGQTALVQITAINRTTHTLTLNSPLTWTAGQGVSLKYTGAAPDLGAFEFGQD